uniref:Uncharacterized protein n=1 Tax=Anopheles atroparvus TaxID=41427 RepID=A0AAG5DW62_ANOAO
MENTNENEDKNEHPRVEIEYCNICNSKPQCLQLATII